MVYITKLALLLTMTIANTTPTLHQHLDQMNQMITLMNEGYTKTFQNVAEKMGGIGQVHTLLLERLLRAEEKIKSFENKITEMTSTMMRQETEIESLRQQIQQKENPSKAATTSDSSKKFIKEPSSVWGQGTDSKNEAIPRVYTLAASKIPNKESYSCDWFKSQTEQLLASNKFEVEIIKVERIPSLYLSAKTKSFKFLLKTKDNLSLNELMQATNWIKGLKIARYRRPPSTYQNEIIINHNKSLSEIAAEISA